MVHRLGFLAKTDSRPCVFRRPSMVAGHFLLLAQKKVTKENGTLGYAPSPAARVRYGWTGSAHRPSMACCPNRRDPSRRPRAGHAAFPSTLRRFSEGTQEQEPSKAEDLSDISGASAAGTAALCSSRAPLGRGEQAQEIAARSAGARRMRARPMSVHGRTVSGPRSLLAKSRGHGCPRDRGREGAFFFGYFLLGKQKKVTGRHGWRT